MLIALAQLLWPVVLKVLGLAASAGLMLFISMVAEECSEDTIR